MLTATDYANAVALINRATLQGTEAESVAALKAKLTQAHKQAKAAEAAPVVPAPDGGLNLVPAVEPGAKQES